MSAAATVIYVWATVQEYAAAGFSAIVIIAAGLGLWYIDVLRKRRDAKNSEGVSRETKSRHFSLCYIRGESFV